MFSEADGETVQAAVPSFKITESDFTVRVYRFRRKPWFIPYRARVFYDPGLQTESVRAIVGDKAFSRHADLRHGTPDRLTS